MSGRTIRQIQAEMDVLSTQMERQYPDTNRDRSVSVNTLSEAFREGSSVAMFSTLMTSAGLVLLVACMNIAGLLLARGLPTPPHAANPSSGTAPMLPGMVGKWRSRFLKDRLEGLYTEQRLGASRKIGDEQIEPVLIKLWRDTRGQTQWSTTEMAKKTLGSAGWLSVESGVRSAYSRVVQKASNCRLTPGWPRKCATLRAFI